MNPSSDAYHAKLREMAEKISHDRPATKEYISAAEVKSLVHDLSVHQIELEMQNEELKHAQREIERVRDRFSRLYQHAPVGYLSLSSNASIKLCNQTFAAMVGVPDTDIIGCSLTDFISSPDDKLFLGRFRAFFRNPTEKHIDIHLRHSNGAHSIVQLTGRIETEPLFAASEPRGDSILLVSVADITEQRRLEEERIQAHQKTLSILESISDAFFSLDESFMVTYFNTAAEKALGRKREDILECNLFEAFPEVRGSVFEEQFTRAMRDKCNINFETYFGVEPYANWYEVRVYPYPKGLSVYFEIITHRKQQEALIVRNESRLKRLVDILQHTSENIQGFLDYALDQAIQLTDSKIGYIYHYDDGRKEFILNTWSKEVMPQCAIADPQTCYELDKTGIWGEAVRQRRPILVNNFEASNPLKKGYPEGHVHLKRFMTVPIFKDGVIVGVVGLANKETDYDDSDVLQASLLMEAVWKVTDRIHAEQSLRRSIREKESLIKEVHHRVKNNLQIISSLLRLQTARTDQPAVRASFIDLQNRIRSMALVHEHLYGSSNLARVDLSTYLKQLSIQLFHSLAPDHGAVRLQMDLDPFEVEIDQAIPCGLLVNELMSNSLKHAFPEGRSGQITLSLKRPFGDDRLCLRICDDGIGLPEGFDLNRQNTLGLTLVADLSHQLGGDFQAFPAKQPQLGEHEMKNSKSELAVITDKPIPAGTIFQVVFKYPRQPVELSSHE